MMLQKEMRDAQAVRQGLDEYRKTVPDGERPCVWAEAGVVPNKLCDHMFECQNCLFDMAMRGDETLLARRLFSRGGRIAPNRFYHRCHTWARVEEQAHVRIGIDDFAQNLLGPLEEISLPIKGERLGRKSIRVKGRGGVFALTPPVEGCVVEVNEALVLQPQMINQSPYKMGWMVLVEPTALERNLKNLVFGGEASEWFDEELERLQGLLFAACRETVDPRVGNTMPDGGCVDFAMLDSLPEAKIRKILGRFLVGEATGDHKYVGTKG